MPARIFYRIPRTRVLRELSCRPAHISNSCTHQMQQHRRHCTLVWHKRPRTQSVRTGIIHGMRHRLGRVSVRPRWRRLLPPPPARSRSLHLRADQRPLRWVCYRMEQRDRAHGDVATVLHHVQIRQHIPILVGRIAEQSTHQVIRYKDAISFPDKRLSSR